LPLDKAQIEAHWKGKRYKRRVAMGCTKQNPDGYDFSQHEPDLLNHKHNPNWLYCTVTRKQVDKTIEAVEKHLKGKTYLKKKAEQPEIHHRVEDAEGLADLYDKRAEIYEEAEGGQEEEGGLEEEEDEDEDDDDGEEEMMARFPFLDEDITLEKGGEKAMKAAKRAKQKGAQGAKPGGSKKAPTEEDDFAAYIAQHGEVKKGKAKIPPPAPKRKRGDGNGGGNNAPGSGKKNTAKKAAIQKHGSGAVAIQNKFKKAKKPIAKA